MIPIYPRVRNLLTESKAELVGVPVGRDGFDLQVSERALLRGMRPMVPKNNNPLMQIRVVPRGVPSPLAERIDGHLTEMPFSVPNLRIADNPLEAALA